MTADAFSWWLVIEGIGLLALPVALVVFRSLPGSGYAFAKPFGLLIGAYVFWLALTLHVLPNRPGSIVWAYVPLAVASFLIIRARRDELIAMLRERVHVVIAVELLFALAFAVAVYLRSFVPEIEGTEKPMDFMLLNAASRSRFYPPDDAWLAGFDVSYYYFGYVIQAMLAKLTAVPTAVAFNLALAGTAALTAVCAFQLGYELVRLGRSALRAAMIAGGAAVIFVAVMGNLEGVAEFAAANGYSARTLADALDVANLESARASEACVVSLVDACLAYPSEESSFWWWWRATRISPDANSITEFPFFSFLLGDLHPHVMSIPFVLSAVGLGVAFWRSEEPLTFEYWRRRPALLLVAGVLIGGLGFLNTWDLPTFGVLLVLLVAARNLASAAAAALRDRLVASLPATLGFCLPLAVLAFLLYAPFYLSFSSQASGLEAVTDGATRPLHSVLFWAPLVAVNLPLPLALLTNGPRIEPRRLMWAIALPVVLLLFWAGVIAFDGASIADAASARGANWLTTLFYAGALVVSLLALARRFAEPGDDDGSYVVPALILMTVAFLLVLGAELFYVQDVFGSRLNTVFKLYYQAWLLLGVSGAFSLYWLFQRLPKTTPRFEVLRGAWSNLVLLLILAALLYPLGATLSRTDGLGTKGRTLDGLARARQAQPDDYAALSWLRDRAGPGESIVEATGGQYSAAARVSAWTGVPTVIGWGGHEVQWGRDSQELSRRQRDVETAYSTESLAEALAILRKYSVTYVFVGSLERGKYPAAGLQKFESGLPLAVRSGQSAVYRVPIEIQGAAETN